MPTPENGAPTDGAKRLGRIISGRYKIRELLGEGGMGSVYLAEHTLMGKRVALKLLHPEMSEDAEVLARFEQEARAAARIDHPNVAAATDFGRAEDGAFFLVLEYVEGRSLRDAIAAGPMPAARALHITRQMALALERAHEAGIVHRDLKPENVMLVQRADDPDFVKVLDFGIAKVTVDSREGAAAGTPLTRFGTIIGTPEYMAPEQALGEAVTPRADLYALGILLYEMLTGLHPFDPPDRATMLSFHIVAPVPKMEDRAPAIDVPPAIEDVVRKLLEKDKAVRHESARALVEAIESAAEASGVVLSLRGDPAGSLRRGDLARLAPPSSPPAGAPANANTTPFPTPSAPTAAALPTAPGTAVASTPTLRWARPIAAVFTAAAALIVLVVVLLVGRGASRTGGVESTPPVSSLTAPVATGTQTRATATQLQLETASAAGAAALEPLLRAFPDDPDVARRLAVAYASENRHADAIRTVRTLLARDPNAADPAIVKAVASAANLGASEPFAGEAFDLLEGPLGERGVDALLDLVRTGTGAARAHAQKSLAKTDVRSHASRAAQIAIELRAARTCDAKRDLLPRAEADGDARALESLRPLTVTRGCGHLGTKDCWSCLRKGSALDDAIATITRRSPTP